MTEPALTEHRLSLGRRKSGRTMANGQCYATLGRCTCGQWWVRSNEAPSRGGNTAVRRAFREHLADPAEPVGSRQHEHLV